MRFGKYHGLGNDFLITDLRAGEPAGEPSVQDPALVRRLCDRHFGVGADGVIAVLPARSAGAAATMRVLNSDGSEAEMCGNGLRCVVKFVVERDPGLARDALTIDTGAGPLTCRVEIDSGVVQSVAVDMGTPRVTRGEVPMIGPPGETCVQAPLVVDGRELRVTGVSMGNPHAVFFVPETGPALLELARRIGPGLETHAWFPRKTNVDLAHVHGPDRIELVVWERGCGITLACGTGASATAVAACLTGRATAGTDIAVALLGGDLSIRVAPDLGGVVMRGPAELVFEVDVDLGQLARSPRRAA
ncbi:MAG TPA: diaminopimelate epimerase [Kofleriaceae bacterium]|nr:diaminopimelate epimerase [Kofleriaceae bacterium]